MKEQTWARWLVVPDGDSKEERSRKRQEILDLFHVGWISAEEACVMLRKCN